MARPTTAPEPTRDPTCGPLAVGRARRTWDGLPVVVRYGVVGGMTQLLYLAVLGAALLLGAHYLVGLALAQLAAMAFAFPAYRGQVFRAEGPVGRQLLAFLGVWWTGAALSVVGVPALVELGGLEPFPAQVLVLVVGMVLGFVGHLRVTFRNRPAVSGPGPTP